MSVLIQNEVASEFLTDDEVQELTGCKQLKQQMDWLTDQGWQYSVNRLNRIKIGRWYARIKLSGIALETSSVDTKNIPRFGETK